MGKRFRRQYEDLLSCCVAEDTVSSSCSYVMNRSKIHRPTCGCVPRPKAAASMASLHSLVGFFDAYGTTQKVRCTRVLRKAELAAMRTPSENAAVLQRLNGQG